MSDTTAILLQVETGDGNKQGKWLLYLTDQIEISPPGVGKCFINPRNINFLGLRHRQKQSELVTQHQQDDDGSQEYSSQYKYSSQQPEFNSIAGNNFRSRYRDWKFIIWVSIRFFSTVHPWLSWLILFVMICLDVFYQIQIVLHIHILLIILGHLMRWIDFLLIFFLLHISSLIILNYLTFQGNLRKKMMNIILPPPRQNHIHQNNQFIQKQWNPVHEQ